MSLYIRIELVFWYNTTSNRINYIETRDYINILRILQKSATENQHTGITGKPNNKSDCESMQLRETQWDSVRPHRLARHDNV